jgi:hypothetical protein
VKKFSTNFVFFFSLFQQLANLNDNQLKDLLEEAVSYRNPKDKEKKSEMFKVLSYFA